MNRGTPDGRGRSERPLRALAGRRLLGSVRELPLEAMLRRIQRRCASRLRVHPSLRAGRR